MNNEEKILQMLTKLTGDVAGLKGDVAELKATQAQQGERLDEMQDTLTRVAGSRRSTRVMKQSWSS